MLQERIGVHVKKYFVKFSILFSILVTPFSFSQGLIMQDFSYPICANGDGESVLNFYESYNGAVNNCEYKVIFVTLFTAW